MDRRLNVKDGFWRIGRLLRSSVPEITKDQTKQRLAGRQQFYLIAPIYRKGRQYFRYVKLDRVRYEKRICT